MIRFRAWALDEKRMYYAAYQKLFGVLLCRDDKGTRNGRGIPVRTVRHDECILMQSTELFDSGEKEIYEGDILEIRQGSRVFREVVPDIPDMYKSRGLHPLQPLLERTGVNASDSLHLRVTGNRYENPADV